MSGCDVHVIQMVVRQLVVSRPKFDSWLGSPGRFFPLSWPAMRKETSAKWRRMNVMKWMYVLENNKINWKSGNMLLCLMFQRFQFFNAFMLHCFNESMPQCFYTSMPQWLNGSVTQRGQRINGSAYQRLNGSTSERLNDWKRLIVSKVQRLKDSQAQRFNVQVKMNVSMTRHQNFSTFQLLNDSTVWNFKTSILQNFIIYKPSIERFTFQHSNAYF